MWRLHAARPYQSGRKIVYSSGKTLRGRKASKTHNVLEPALHAAVDTVPQRDTSNRRRGTEYSVCALKAPFGSLRLPFTAGAFNWFRILQSLMHIYDFWTWKVALNELQTAYGYKNISQHPWTDRLAQD